MPTRTRQLDLSTARAHIRERYLQPSTSHGQVGLECEWHVVRRDDPCAVVPLAELRSVIEAAGPPPASSHVTYEPGGQIELAASSRPAPGRRWKP